MNAQTLLVHHKMPARVSRVDCTHLLIVEVDHVLMMAKFTKIFVRNIQGGNILGVYGRNASRGMAVE